MAHAVGMIRASSSIMPGDRPSPSKSYHPTRRPASSPASCAPHRGRQQDPARRAHAHRRQGRRHGGLDRRGVPRGQIPALRRALLPQCAGQGPQIEALPGRGHAQGDPRDEIARALGAKAESVAGELGSMELKEAAKVVREDFTETLTYCEYRASIGGASARIMRPSGSTGESALMLMVAQLEHVADSE